MTKNSRPSIELSDLKANPLPRHVAIIMDGNGRWAQTKRRPRLWGHRAGVKSVQEVVKAAGELGIEVLTLYAFSEENWGRPADEVSGLMSLLDTYIVKEKKELAANNVQLRTIGRISALPEKTRFLLEQTSAELANNTGLILNIALSYSAQAEITHACKEIAEKVRQGLLSAGDINPACFSDHLWTKGLPDPDLLIRTSGEQRLSNFLLWQASYAELWFSSTLWPDFQRPEFFEAIRAFQSRKRRFGLVKGESARTNLEPEVAIPLAIDPVVLSQNLHHLS